jgi:hypothetical protein
MATSASQTYIARLGFQDRDRSNQRHGLACEYLFERMLELEVAPQLLKLERADLEYKLQALEREQGNLQALEREQGNYTTWTLRFEKLAEQISQLRERIAALSIEQSMKEAQNVYKAGQCIHVPIMSRSYVNGFADVLIVHSSEGNGFLGEVKITKEPAENVLQQINFYLSYLGRVVSVYILTDYDPGDLKRLCAGTNIKVYRLGQVFEQWLASRTVPATEEL